MRFCFPEENVIWIKCFGKQLCTTWTRCMTFTFPSQGYYFYCNDMQQSNELLSDSRHSGLLLNAGQGQFDKFLHSMQGCLGVTVHQYYFAIY